MSEPFTFQRRDFLKLVGLGLAGTAAGCGEAPANKLIPYLIAPHDILPGVPYWYASTCRECPAGCGTLVKTREGRTIKIEGNPDHPVNRGVLCAKGSAGIMQHYSPARLHKPLLRTGERGKNEFREISWDEALALATQWLA